jgi:hypothetical protein
MPTASIVHKLSLPGGGSFEYKGDIDAKLCVMIGPVNVVNGTPQTLPIAIESSTVKFIALTATKACTVAFTGTTFSATLAPGEVFAWPNGTANPFNADATAVVLTATGSGETSRISGLVGHNG